MLNSDKTVDITDDEECDTTGNTSNPPPEKCVDIWSIFYKTGKTVLIGIVCLSILLSAKHLGSKLDKIEDKLDKIEKTQEKLVHLNR